MLVIPTGVPKLDFMLGGGLTTESSVLLAGRPATGKTTLACRFAAGATRAGARAALYSLEHDEFKIQGLFRSRSWPADSGFLSLHTPRGLTTSDLRAAEHERSAPGPRAVIVDYLQLMTDNERHALRPDFIRSCCFRIHRMGRDLGRLMIVVAQLGADTEGAPLSLELIERSPIPASCFDTVLLLGRGGDSSNLVLAKSLPTKTEPVSIDW